MTTDKYDRRRNLDHYVSPSERLERRSKSSDSNWKGWVLYLAMFLLIFGPLTYWTLKDHDYFKKGDTPIETPSPTTHSVPSTPTKLIGPSSIEPEHCTNGIDDDGDGDSDCMDSDCATHVICKPLKHKPGTACKTGKEKPCDKGLWTNKRHAITYKQICIPRNVECIIKEICTNGIDDDYDGDVDCYDIDCENHVICIPLEVCTDGLDNDGDGKADCYDADCENHIGCQPSKEICNDGWDNDGDGFVDCLDPDCSQTSPCNGK